MASFTDPISQFNPYVQQLPVEQMVQVGMQKQAQYDQGVQKIQTYIDNIAGMDVIKGEHKQYLQSKLNELGSRLKTVAAGDFSNQQLVNSVGGMATQIIKDPTVQRAVYSTQKVRKGQQRLEEARKAGKSSPNNEAYWNNTINSWLNDKDINTEFNGDFIEHTDVDKKLRDLASKLKEEEIGIENPYVRDDKGNTLYFDAKGNVSLDPSKGEKKLDLDMLSIKTKGLPAEKILNNFYDSLDSNDEQQLRIDAWAHYRGAGPQKFKDDIIAAYDDKKEMLNEQIVNLGVQLQNPNLTSVQKAQGQAKLKDLQDMQKNGTLDKELASSLSELDSPSGLENFKYKVYSQKYLTNLARDISTKSYVQERKNNPAWQAQMEQKKFIFDQKKFIDESARGWANVQTAKARLAFDVEKDRLDRAGTGLTDVSDGTIATGAATPTIDSKRKELEGQLKQQTELQNEYASKLFPGTNFTSQQRWDAFQKLSEDYKANPRMNLTPDQAKYLEKARKLEGDIAANVNLVSSAIKHAQTQTKKAIDNEIGWVQVQADNGRTYSGEEISDVASNMKRFQVYGQFGGGLVFDDKAAANFFNTYKGGALAPIANAYIRNKSVLTKLTPNEKAIVKVFNNIESATNKAINNIPKAESDFLSKYDFSSLSQKATLSPDNVKGDKLAIDKFLAKKINEAQSVGGAGEGWSPSTVSEWQTASSTGKNAKQLSYVFEKKADGTGQLVISDGTSQQIIPAKPQDIVNYFPQAAAYSPFNAIKKQIMTSPGFTTNGASSREDNPYNAVNAKYSGYDLPLMSDHKLAPMVRVDIEGDTDNIGDAQTDGYSVIMYVQDPKTQTWKRQRLNKGYINEGGVMNIISNINPTAVQEAIKTWK